MQECASSTADADWRIWHALGLHATRTGQPDLHLPAFGIASGEEHLCSRCETINALPDLQSRAISLVLRLSVGTSHASIGGIRVV